MSEYISVHKFAKLKGVSPQNVYRWIREGKLKAEKIEKTVIRLMVAADSSPVSPDLTA